MKKIICFIVLFMFVFGLANIDEAKAKKKTAKEDIANEQTTKEPASEKKETSSKDGWIAVNINRPDLAKAEYKIDWGKIEFRFINLVDGTLRVMYDISWENKINDKWEKN